MFSFLFLLLTVCISIHKSVDEILVKQYELTSMHNRTFRNTFYIVIMGKDSQLPIIQEVITWRIWPGTSTSLFDHATAHPQTERQLEMKWCIYLSVYRLPIAQWKEVQSSWWQKCLGITCEFYISMESWQSFTC